LFAAEARRLVLVARNRARLEALRAELLPTVRVDVQVEPQAALCAGTIIAAASAAEPILRQSELTPGTIVCDVGFPKNLAEASESREDVLVFAGGLAELPEPIDLHSYTELATPSLLHGCFCEGIVLAASRKNLDLAAAQGRAATDRARALLEAARRLGIVPAPPYKGARLVRPEEIAALPGRQEVYG
jgi:predicted amino acid dehydrogenase